MDHHGPSVPQRVAAVLKAKQFLVFYAIALTAWDLVSTLLASWLRTRAPVTRLVAGAWGPLADAVAARSPLIAALFVVSLLVTAWFRAGYLRSLLGRLRFRPSHWRQFARLLGLELLLAVVGALAVAAVVRSHGVLSSLALVGSLAVYLVTMYTDYAIVVADVGLARALWLSWRTVRAFLGASLFVMLNVTVASQLLLLLVASDGFDGLAGLLPLLVVKTVLLGGVVFVADVALLVVLLHAREQGRVPLR
jgi:hypothetical protein